MLEEQLAQERVMDRLPKAIHFLPECRQTDATRKRKREVHVAETVKQPPVLIQMNNGEGPLVEVTLILPQARMMSEAHVAKVVSNGFEAVIGMLKNIVRPFSETWRELSKEVVISESIVKLSLGITAEGNFFVAKGSAEANIEIELKLTPK